MKRYFKSDSIDENDQSNNVALYIKLEFDTKAEKTYVERKTETKKVIIENIAEKDGDVVNDFLTETYNQNEDWKEISETEYSNIK